MGLLWILQYSHFRVCWFSFIWSEYQSHNSANVSDSSFCVVMEPCYWFFFFFLNVGAFYLLSLSVLLLFCVRNPIHPRRKMYKASSGHRRCRKNCAIKGNMYWQALSDFVFFYVHTIFMVLLSLIFSLCVSCCLPNKPGALTQKKNQPGPPFILMFRGFKLISARLVKTVKYDRLLWKLLDWLKIQFPTPPQQLKH